MIMLSFLFLLTDITCVKSINIMKIKLYRIYLKHLSQLRDRTKLICFGKHVSEELRSTLILFVDGFGSENFLARGFD